MAPKPGALDPSIQRAAHRVNMKQTIADRRTRYKREAAEAAADRVASGDIVGLGTGSTAVWVVRGLAERLARGRLSDILCIATSQVTEDEARRSGLALTTLGSHPVVDITIDGADEIDPRLNVIKGGGGALLREKIVALASRRWVVVADESKLSDALGQRRSLPVEVVRFGWQSQKSFLERLGANVARRVAPDGIPFVTEQGHYILDCRFGPLKDVHTLATTIKARTGVVEHGFFLDMAHLAIVAGAQGVRCFPLNP